MRSAILAMSAALPSVPWLRAAAAPQPGPAAALDAAEGHALRERFGSLSDLRARLPALPSMADISSGLSGMPAFRDLDAVRGFDDLRALPEISSLRAWPDLRGLPSIPSMADISSGLSGMPAFRDLDAMRDVDDRNGDAMDAPTLPGLREALASLSTVWNLPDWIAAPRLGASRRASPPPVRLTRAKSREHGAGGGIALCLAPSSSARYLRPRGAAQNFGIGVDTKGRQRAARLGSHWWAARCAQE